MTVSGGTTSAVFQTHPTTIYCPVSNTISRMPSLSWTISKLIIINREEDGGRSWLFCGLPAALFTRMVTDGRMLVQIKTILRTVGARKRRPSLTPFQRHGRDLHRGCPRLVRALRLQGSQPTDGLGRDRMNAVSLRTESFTAVDQPNSLFKSQTAVTWRTKDNVLSASPSPRPSLSRPSARRAGEGLAERSALNEAAGQLRLPTIKKLHGPGSSQQPGRVGTKLEK